MKDLFNRRIAWLLIALMLCALVPLPAFAAASYDVDPEYWETIQDVLVPITSKEQAASDGIYAILYEDGTLAFQSGDTPEAGQKTTAIYPVNLDGYASEQEIPWYSERNSIKTVKIVSVFAPRSVAFWFKNCAKLEQFIGVENLRMNQATTMRDMFYGCASLKSLNLDVDAKSRWYTIKVKDMSGVFCGCAALTELDASLLKTPALENLEDAFAGCTGLKGMSLTRWDVSHVTNMKGMFRGCTQLAEVDLSGWDTSNVTDMSAMFYQCGNLASIKASGSFVTGQVTGSADMFTGCGALRGANGTAYSASHTDKTYARIDAGTGQPGYFSAGVFAILYADGTLAFQYGETPDGREVIKTFTVDMSNKYVFESGKINVPWLADDYCNRIKKVDFVDVIAPRKPRYWFYQCVTLEEVLHPEHLNLSRAIEINDMFYGCKNLRSLDVSSWDTSNLTGGHGLFYGCESLTELDVSGFDTSNMTNMSGMFYGCSNVSALDVSGFDTGKVTTFSSMFRDCSKLTELDVSNWDTSSAQQMGAMFLGCTGLTELDLSNWDTSQCFYYSTMFQNATNLKTIWASDKFVLYDDGIMVNYDARGVNVFTGCTSLVGGSGTTYDPERVDYHYLRIDSADAPGYFSVKALRLSDELPLTQANAPVDRSALGSLSALNVKLDSANPGSTDVIFVAAFYDASGVMLNAFLAQVTVQPNTRTITIPTSSVSGQATKLQVFALSTQYAPLTSSRRFQLN